MMVTAKMIDKTMAGILGKYLFVEELCSLGCKMETKGSGKSNESKAIVENADPVGVKLGFLAKVRGKYNPKNESREIIETITPDPNRT